MLKNKLLSIIALLPLSFSSLASAATTQELSLDGDGTFHCVVNTMNPLATVNFDTNRVKISGFCEGQKYVTSSGHVQKMPVTILKRYYFQFKEDGMDNNSVTITSSTDDGVTCSVGTGDRTKEYGDGKYC